jgi:hypothetical protein
MEDLRAAVLNLVSVNLNGEKITNLFSLTSNGNVDFQSIINVAKLGSKMSHNVVYPAVVMASL